MPQARIVEVFRFREPTPPKWQRRLESAKFYDNFLNLEEEHLIVLIVTERT